jgi:hypothetical protein
MGGVEFVSENQPTPPPTPPTSRRAWIVRIAVVAIVIVAGATWAATRPSAPQKAARAQNSAAAHSTAPHPHIGPVQTIVTCVSGAPVDDEITHAMHRFLRGIAVENMLAARCIQRAGDDRQVIAETVTGLIGRDEVEVSVSNRDTGYAPPPRISRLGSRQANLPIGGVETESAGLKVRITVSGPATETVALQHIHRLADFLCLNLPW